MDYQEYRPTLLPFIDCYWTHRQEAVQPGTIARRVLPDIVLSLGPDVQL